MVQSLILSILVILACSSCAHAPVKNKTVSNPVAVCVQGVVLDQDALKEGGTLGLTPLKPGPLAEANDELDRISSVVVRAMKESLENQKSSLHIVTGSEDEPKLVFEGYVEELSKSGKFSGFMLRPQMGHLVLVGDIWMVQTGKRVLEFSVERKFNFKKHKVADVAFEMGQELGRFIASGGSQEYRCNSK